MIIVYSPEGGAERRWDLKQVKVLAAEAEVVEKVTDLTWGKVKSNLLEGSISAQRAVAFILLKREEPTLRYSAFNPPEEELDVDFDAEERAALRAAIEESDDINESQRAQALAQLADPEDAAEDEAPKDLSEAAPSDLPEALPQEASPLAA